MARKRSLSRSRQIGNRSVRSLGTFTRDLHELADWLQTCGVTTVAMESTGVYWIRSIRFWRRRGFRCFS